MTHPNLALAVRFVTAIEAGDIDAIRAIYAPDARVWHNTDGIEFPGQTVDENLKVLAWMGRFLRDKHYDIVRRSETATGCSSMCSARRSPPPASPTRCPRASSAPSSTVASPGATSIWTAPMWSR